MSERIPLPFPTGWFCVRDAADLAPGQVVRSRIDGLGSQTFEIGDADLATLDQLRVALEAVRGLLRSAVGGAIHRKRVPGLRIQVVPKARQ